MLLNKLPIIDGKKAVLESKNKKGLLLIVLLVLSILLYLFVQDDELNSEIQPILDQYNTQHILDDNGSVYQLGMWSALGTSPYDVGLWRLNKYNDALSTDSYNVVDVKFDDYPKENWIESLYPEDKIPDLLCDFNKVACLELIYKDPSNISALIADNSEYIKRYEGLMKFDSFKLYEEPSSTLPMMMFGPSLDILKLKLIDIIKDVKQGEIGIASSKLIELIKHNRRVLEQTPYVIPKVISMVESEMIIDIFAFILSKRDDIPPSLWKEVIASLKPLTENQLKLNTVFLYEFVAQAKMFDVLNSNDYRRDLPTVIKYIPLSLMFKKNRSLNMLYDETTRYFNRLEFVGEKIKIIKGNERENVVYFDYKNALGSFLLMTALPRFIELENQVYNIEIKQRMLKHLFELKIIKSDTYKYTTYKSPYTGKEAHVIDNHYCITVDDDNENDICISNF
jgi:hypothetical protein